MNMDRWHIARSTFPPRSTPHLRGSMKCVGRCGATISANAKPPLCRACGLLFQAQVEADTARVEAARAAVALEQTTPEGQSGSAEGDPHPPAGEGQNPRREDLG